MLQGVAQQRGNAGVLGHVDLDEVGLAAGIADFLRHPLAARGVHVGDYNPGALLGEGLGDAFTKAGTGAGDDGSFMG